MSLGCFRCRNGLLTIQAGHATEAERLEVESHLSECEACRDEQARFSVVAELKSAPAQRLSSEARERVRRAMMTAALEGSPRRAVPVPSHLRLAVGGALAVAAACVLVLGGVARFRHPTLAEVVTGDVAVAGVLASPGTAILDGQELRTDASHSGVVRLDGPVVRLGNDTHVAWRRGTRTLDLQRGQVTVEVEPNRGIQFRVATARFAAEVVGTRFEVTESSVVTYHGRVRVVGSDGKELAMVGAGERWTWPQPVPPPPPAPPVVEVAAASPPTPVTTLAAAPVATSSSPTAAATPTVLGRPTAVAAVESVPTHGRSLAARPPRPEPAAVSAERTLLDEAHHAAGDGRYGDVRSLVSQLRLGRPTARMDAEAGLLLGDAARSEGRTDEALRRYRDVLERHGALPAAESALFAIGLLELQAGRTDDARRTLRDYLARYPNGTYLAEARTRLSHLDAP